jgi:hypothetical protein
LTNENVKTVSLVKEKEPVKVSLIGAQLPPPLLEGQQNLPLLKFNEKVLSSFNTSLLPVLSVCERLPFTANFT